MAPLTEVISDSKATPNAKKSKMSRRWSSSRRNPWRVTSQAASTGPSVLPEATAAAVIKGAPKPNEMMNAPTVMAGHRGRPKRSNAAKASPLGGQTKLTKSPTWGTDRPRRPLSTYSSASVDSCASQTREFSGCRQVSKAKKDGVSVATGDGGRGSAEKAQPREYTALPSRRAA